MRTEGRTPLPAWTWLVPLLSCGMASVVAPFVIAMRLNTVRSWLWCAGFGVVSIAGFAMVGSQPDGSTTGWSTAGVVLLLGSLVASIPYTMVAGAEVLTRPAPLMPTAPASLTTPTPAYAPRTTPAPWHRHVPCGSDARRHGSWWPRIPTWRASCGSVDPTWPAATTTVVWSTSTPHPRSAGARSRAHRGAGSTGGDGARAPGSLRAGRRPGPPGRVEPGSLRADRRPGPGDVKQAAPDCHHPLLVWWP